MGTRDSSPNQDARWEAFVELIESKLRSNGEWRDDERLVTYRVQNNARLSYPQIMRYSMMTELSSFVMDLTRENLLRLPSMTPTQNQNFTGNRCCIRGSNQIARYAHYDAVESFKVRAKKR